MKKQLVCKHGSLKRSCYTCELETEVARLKAELGKYNVKCVGESDNVTHGCCQCFADHYGNILYLLAKERDAWGKRETELMAELSKSEMGYRGASSDRDRWQKLAGELAEAARNCVGELGLNESMAHLEDTVAAYDSVVKKEPK